MSDLADLLTPEQQSLLAKHIIVLKRAGYGKAILQIHEGRVYRIGLEIMEDAGSKRLSDTLPAVIPVAKRRRR